MKLKELGRPSYFICDCGYTIFITRSNHLKQYYSSIIWDMLISYCKLNICKKVEEHVSNVIQVPGIFADAIIISHQLIFSQCYISIPPENIRKPSGFLMFSGGIEM